MPTLEYVGKPLVPIAESVRYVAQLLDYYAQRIMDRDFFLNENFIRSILGQSVFNWEDRDMSLALNPDGTLRTRNLDLFSFLVPLAEKGAIIGIPDYKNRGPVVKESCERRVGQGVFGPLKGLVSSKKTFAFSLSVDDQNLLVTLKDGSEKVGWVHNYMMVDHSGKQREDFGTLVVENFGGEGDIFQNLNFGGLGQVALDFKHYIHPNRWQSIYGAPYLLLKMLLERLKDEIKFLNDEIGRLKNAGIRGKMFLDKRDRTVMHKGPKKNIEVSTLQFVLDLPPFSNSYAPLPKNLYALNLACSRRKQLLYHFIPIVQFVTRADEAAYFLHGLKNNSVAHWMRGAKWEDNYRRGSGRTLWRRMPLSETGNMSLLYREHLVTKQVSAE